MIVFGASVLAKDMNGKHYANLIVYASDILMVESIVIEHYSQSDEEFIKIDQIVGLEDMHADGLPRVLDTVAKNYYKEEDLIEFDNKIPKTFQVTFEGAGYDLLTESNQKIGGFFVSVLTSAPEPEQAFEIAYQKLINSQSYQDLVAGHEHPDAVLSVHQCNELTDVDLNAPDISGFVFYPPDDQTEHGSASKH